MQRAGAGLFNLLLMASTMIRMAKLKTRKIKNPAVRLEWVEAGSLAENPLNWRRHPAAQMSALKELIRDKDVGWAGALLYNEKTGRLIDGHARRKAVDPKTPVPVLIGSWSVEAEKKILLTLDPLASLAVPDAEALQSLLDEVPLDSTALEGLGDNLLEQLEALEAAGSGDDEDGDRRGVGEGNGSIRGANDAEFRIVIDCKSERHQKQLCKRFEKEGLKFNLLVAP